MRGGRRWLERNLIEPTVTRQDKAVRLRQAVQHLMEKRGMKLEELAYRKFRLRASLEQRIKEAKHQAKKTVHQQMQLHDEWFGVREDCALVFELGRYVYDDTYHGPVDLKKHFFPVIGNLKPEGEEFECAEYLANQCSAVETWVRNVEKKPGAFSLQTSTDRFYPDFVCRLKGGKILAVEHKSEMAYTNDDSVEKRVLGGLWAKASNGKCKFVMTKGKTWDWIEKAVAA